MQSPWKAEQFASWQPIARKTATEHLALLNQLPPSFAPFLLKEIYLFDWKFPAERADMLAQLRYLETLPPAEREREMAPLARLKLAPELLAFDTVSKPSEFLEKLSASLWATGQMDSFRTASEQYMAHFRQSYPESAPSAPRLAIVLMGAGVNSTEYPLFRKLRRQGTLFRNVQYSDGLKQISELLERRVGAQTEPYALWRIDGESAAGRAGVASVSFQPLSPMRLALANKFRQAFETRMSPEVLRTMLADTTPETLGLHASTDALLDRFALSLFTEGSGTQIYSTTFVQWASREVLRRAKPLTVVARYAPRVRESSMRDLLSGAHAGLDPAGSLIDADMGAWYTWIGLQRLTGSKESNFVAWFEEHGQTVALGPSFPHAIEEANPIRLADILSRISS